MSNLSDWIHDDITWCGNECYNTACERNMANKLSHEGLFSMALFKGTTTCPLNRLTGNNKKKGQKVMNKKELVEKLIEKSGEKKAEKVLNAFVETVKEAVAKGDNVQLVGFGTFEARERASREARNPQTGETVFIPAKKVPAFKPGKGFKEAVK